MSPDSSPESPAAAEILRLTALRGTEKSICPSEVARVLAEDGKWQSLMSVVRQAAIGLARDGRIDILRKGRAIDPGEVRGVIRLRSRAEKPSSNVPLDPPDPPE